MATLDVTLDFDGRRLNTRQMDFPPFSAGHSPTGHFGLTLDRIVNKIRDRILERLDDGADGDTQKIRDWMRSGGTKPILSLNLKFTDGVTTNIGTMQAEVGRKYARQAGVEHMTGVVAHEFDEQAHQWFSIAVHRVADPTYTKNPGLNAIRAYIREAP